MTAPPAVAHQHTVERRGPRGSIALLLSLADDPHVRAVEAELTRIGAHVLVLDSCAFATHWGVSWQLEGANDRCALWSRDGVVDGDRLAGVWHWHPAAPASVLRVQDPLFRSFAHEEVLGGCTAWLRALGSRVINAVAVVARYTDRTEQLRTAHACGLRVPRTIVTNVADDARRFLGDVCDVLVKPVTHAPVPAVRRISRDDAPMLHRLELAPVLLQELVPGTDVRATVVDDRVFCSEILPTLPVGVVDWRLDPAPRVRAHRLPDDVADAMLRLRAHMGFRLASLDLRRTPEGEYVFLECNLNGQYMVSDPDSCRRITQAVARSLIDFPPGG